MISWIKIKLILLLQLTGEFIFIWATYNNDPIFGHADFIPHRGQDAHSAQTNAQTY